MHSRLLSLIERGYSVDDVVSLSSFTDKELDYAVDMAFEYLTRNCFPVDDKSAIFIGGQPGSGKTVLSIKLKEKMKNVVEIGIDNYRMYHPRYLEMEKCIKAHWFNRKQEVNDTPGNDIADFTHVFAGIMTDKLIERCSTLGYNLVIEWGMREPDGPLKTMENLKNKKYNNLVLFVATYKELSFHACELRADVMGNSQHIIRKVPKSFHDFCVETLPDSVNKIYYDGYHRNIVDQLLLVARDGSVLWDDRNNKMPGEIYRECINNYNSVFDMMNDPNISIKNNKEELSLILTDENKNINNIYSIIIPNLDKDLKIR